MSLRLSPAEAPTAAVSLDAEDNKSISRDHIYLVAKNRRVRSKLPFSNPQVAFWTYVVQYAEELKETVLGKKTHNATELDAIIAEANERMRALAAQGS